MSHIEYSPAGTFQRESLFMTLKRALKARGITYAMLAQSLQVSELTIKRLFREKDCKISRLMGLCQAASISLEELLEMQQRHYKKARYLPEETEQALANEPALFTFLILLITRIDVISLHPQWGLSKAQVYQLFRRLEKLGILTLLPDDRFEYTIPLPVRWRMNGPLSETIHQANTSFLRLCLSNETDPQTALCNASRQISEQTASVIRERLQELGQEFEYLATQDQLFLEANELIPYKLLACMAPFPILDLFPPSVLSDE